LRILLVLVLMMIMLVLLLLVVNEYYSTTVHTKGIGDTSSDVKEGVTD
jgi:hypothetical protein